MSGRDMLRNVSLAILMLSATTCAVQGGRVRPAAPVLWTPVELASGAYESSPVFAADGSQMYFFRADRDYGNYSLLWSRCAGGRWSPPVAPPFARPVGVLEADPALSPDGRWLYFVSARGDETGDDLDIWRTERRGDGWGEPQRLPRPVNSAFAELLPRPQADGRLLFGSSRPGGYGQGDIYIATPRFDGSWRVDNVGPPISTPANEYEAELSRDGRVLVTVADRGDRSHLYVYDRDRDGWRERGRARDDVFQVGPLLSPTGDRLLFAQVADADRSGEWFLVDLAHDPDPAWPPSCG